MTENKFPNFTSLEEAKNYFEEKYGEKFVFEESSTTENGMGFYYRLITDEAAYIKGITELNSTGSVGIEFKKSYQSIQIMENGIVNIVH